MIEDFKNILSREDFRYLIFLFFGMLISALIEMVGLSSIPVFIMIIVDINTLIEKFPNFFAIDYKKKCYQQKDPLDMRMSVKKFENSFNVVLKDFNYEINLLSKEYKKIK